MLAASGSLAPRRPQRPEPVLGGGRTNPGHPDFRDPPLTPRNKTQVSLEGFAEGGVGARAGVGEVPVQHLQAREKEGGQAGAKYLLLSALVILSGKWGQ